jgi:hypothetical protein
MMTVGALHPQESLFQPTTFEVIGKFLLHMQRQGLALHGHHIPELRVVSFNLETAVDRYVEVVTT